MKIGVNCGHTVSGTTGCGAVGYINESDEARAVGMHLKMMLRANGHFVVDCTNDYASSVSQNLRKIEALANAQPLDLFVSLHFNSGGGKGVEVFTYGGKEFDEAINTHQALANLGFKPRGIKDGSHLAVVKNTNAKAMLVEVCFVDTKSDVDLYNSVGAYRVAAAICQAITGAETKDEEELTMSQYEELKERIEELENPMIYNYIDDNMPSWAREAVKWCVDKGIIAGTGDGLGLDDMKLWTCVVVYRTAKVIAGLFKVKI